MFFVSNFIFHQGPGEYSNQPRWTGHPWVNIVEYKIQKYILGAIFFFYNSFRMVHGFTSSGILESQYQGFAEAGKIGNVGDKYIDNGKALTSWISFISSKFFSKHDKCYPSSQNPNPNFEGWGQPTSWMGMVLQFLDFFFWHSFSDLILPVKCSVVLSGYVLTHIV